MTPAMIPIRSDACFPPLVSAVTDGDGSKAAVRATRVGNGTPSATADVLKKAEGVHAASAL